MAGAATHHGLQRKDLSPSRGSVRSGPSPGSSKVATRQSLLLLRRGGMGLQGDRAGSALFDVEGSCVAADQDLLNMIQPAEVLQSQHLQYPVQAPGTIVEDTYSRVFVGWVA